MTKSKIFQHNTFTTLSGGFYEGTISLAEALKHGAAGIGTLDTANGEVTIWDGIAYHGDAQNHVRQVEADETLPYVALVDHQALKTFTDSSSQPSEEFLSNVVAQFPTENTAYTIVIKGHFKSMTISSKPANNTRPYAEILADQPYFTRENVAGTLVGIWAPEHLSDLFGAGFHLHFISDDKQFSAHTQNFITEDVTVEFGQIAQIEQEFPTGNTSFNQKKILT